MVLKRVILFKPKIFPVTLFITLNAFSFHSTKAKVLKKEYKAQYDSTPCYLIFCHFSPCLLCSILTDPYQRMFLTQGLWTFNLLYLECSSSKYLYLCSLASFRSLFSHILPSLSLYTVVTAPPSTSSCPSLCPSLNHMLCDLRGFVLVTAIAPLSRSVSGM